MSQKTVTTHSGNQTETKTYTDGKCTDIQHTDNRTGENHSHVVGHGIMGSYAKEKK